MRFCCIALVLLSCLNFGGSQTAKAEQVKLDVAMGYPTMYIAEEGKKGTNHVRIALTGFEMPAAEERLPINVAIVIDKSGSMQGDKIAQARAAALQAIDRLRDDDIVSIVTYDSTVNVLVPATKASDRAEIKKKIRSISPGGNTALFAGVSKGAAETRKFLDDNRVNRVILLSDGLANVGPSSPSELRQLGASLIKEGISVSTMGLGLGYNEDLLSGLALSSSGNHVFIEDAENLVGVFQNEFDDVMSVVAQKLRINAKLSEGIRPVKVLNYPADITGQKVSIDLGQLYARQERYFVLEVEIPFGENEATAAIADVNLEYTNMLTETKDKLSSAVEVKFSNDEKLAQQSISNDVMSCVVTQIANCNNADATRWRDEGNVEKAKETLLGNSFYLKRYATLLKSEKLEELSRLNESQSNLLDDKNWNLNRKAMRGLQYQQLSQQRFDGSKKEEPKQEAKPSKPNPEANKSKSKTW